MLLLSNSLVFSTSLALAGIGAMKISAAASMRSVGSASTGSASCASTPTAAGGQPQPPPPVGRPLGSNDFERAPRARPQLPLLRHSLSESASAVAWRKSLRPLNAGGEPFLPAPRGCVAPACRGSPYSTYFSTCTPRFGNGQGGVGPAQIEKPRQSGPGAPRGRSIKDAASSFSPAASATDVFMEEDLESDPEGFLNRMRELVAAHLHAPLRQQGLWDSVRVRADAERKPTGADAKEGRWCAPGSCHSMADSMDNSDQHETAAPAPGVTLTGGADAFFSAAAETTPGSTRSSTVGKDTNSCLSSSFHLTTSSSTTTTSGGAGPPNDRSGKYSSSPLRFLPACEGREDPDGEDAKELATVGEEQHEPHVESLHDFPIDVALRNLVLGNQKKEAAQKHGFWPRVAGRGSPCSAGMRGSRRSSGSSDDDMLPHHDVDCSKSDQRLSAEALNLSESSGSAPAAAGASESCGGGGAVSGAERDSDRRDSEDKNADEVTDTNTTSTPRGRAEQDQDEQLPRQHSCSSILDDPRRFLARLRRGAALNYRRRIAQAERERGMRYGSAASAAATMCGRPPSYLKKEYRFLYGDPGSLLDGTRRRNTVHKWCEVCWHLDRLCDEHWTSGREPPKWALPYRLRGNKSKNGSQNQGIF